MTSLPRLRRFGLLGRSTRNRSSRALRSTRPAHHSAWRVLPNQRLKLSARGGHTCRKKSVSSVAAAGRSLSAIR
jgi:hypothetical protein